MHETQALGAAFEMIETSEPVSKMKFSGTDPLTRTFMRIRLPLSSIGIPNAVLSEIKLNVGSEFWRGIDEFGEVAPLLEECETKKRRTEKAAITTGTTLVLIISFVRCVVRREVKAKRSDKKLMLRSINKFVLYGRPLINI
jgi:hypothetical protein